MFFILEFEWLYMCIWQISNGCQNLKFDWIETIVGVNEEVILYLYQENHMTIINVFLLSIFMAIFP
jgi:hypothetical protein